MDVLKLEVVGKAPEVAHVTPVYVSIILVRGVENKVEVPRDHPRRRDGLFDATQLIQKNNFVVVRHQMWSSIHGRILVQT